MATLDEMALSHGTDKSSLRHNYAVKYERIMAPMRDRAKKILEIGVLEGFSLRMWRDFFPFATIYGLDVDARCQRHQEARIQILSGDQGNKADLERAAAMGPFDVVLDDGSHKYEHQILSFQVLWNAIAPGGIYVVEDVCTSYWKGYGSGQTTINYFKGIVDWVNFYGAQVADQEVARREDWIIPFLAGKVSYPLDIYSVSFLNSCVMVEKRG